MPGYRNAALTCALLLTIALVTTSCAAVRTTATPIVSTDSSQSVKEKPPVAGQYASEVPAEEREFRPGDLTPPTTAGGDGYGSIPVAYEVKFVLNNRSRIAGGYDATLKDVVKIDYYGARYVDCDHYSLELHSARPAGADLLLKSATDTLVFESNKSGRHLAIRGHSQGVTNEAERALIETFDFDTPVLDLESPHPTLKPIGVEKLPGILAWKFQTAGRGGYYRILYIDSHSGDVVKYTVMSRVGAVVVDVTLHDYRVTDGIRVPFAIDYRGPDGTLLANDRLERVQTTRREGL